MFPVNSFCYFFSSLLWLSNAMEFAHLIDVHENIVTLVQLVLRDIKYIDDYD